MPPLDNPRHEKFAQELAKGNPAGAAYRLAGYDADEKSAETAGPRLFRKIQIQARVAELQQRGAERAEITVQSLIEECEAARLLAMNIEQPSAAIAAVKEKGVLSGCRVERSAAELTGADGGPIETTEVSGRELIERRILSLASRGTAQGNPGKPH